MLLNLANLTRQELSQNFNSVKEYVLPIGSTEQHGPHLPYNTDTLLAQHFAKQVAQRINAFLLPPLHYGYSWVWRDIPGSITISLDSFQGLLKDIARSLERLGAHRLIIVNGHDANNASLKYVARDLADELEIEIYHLFYPDIKEAMTRFCTSSTWDGIFHADELETSLMLYVHPELVQMKHAIAEYPKRPLGYGSTSLSLGKISQSGVYGDPTAASVEKGQKLSEFFVERMLKILLKI